MAETLLDALIKLNFEGEGAVGQAADAVKRVEAAFRQLTNLPSANFDIGGDLPQTLGTLSDIQAAFGRLITLGQQAEQALRLDPKQAGAAEQVSRITDALTQQIGVIRQVEAAQTRANESAIAESRRVEAELDRENRARERNARPYRGALEPLTERQSGESYRAWEDRDKAARQERAQREDEERRAQEAINPPPPPAPPQTRDQRREEYRQQAEDIRRRLEREDEEAARQEAARRATDPTPPVLRNQTGVLEAAAVLPAATPASELTPPVLRNTAGLLEAAAVLAKVTPGPGEAPSIPEVHAESGADRAEARRSDAELTAEASDAAREAKEKRAEAKRNQPRGEDGRFIPKAEAERQAAEAAAQAAAAHASSAKAAAGEAERAAAGPPPIPPGGHGGGGVPPTPPTPPTPPPGGGGGGGAPLSNFARLERAILGTDGNPADLEKAARGRVALAQDEKREARIALNKLDPATDDNYAAAERRAARAIIAEESANAGLERAIKNRIAAETQAAESARKAAEALAVRGSQGFQNQINPDQAQFLHSVGINPDADVATQRAQLAQRLKETDLAINKAESEALISDEELAKLKRERAQLEVGLNSAVARETAIADKKAAADAKAAEAARVRATPEAQDLKADPNRFLRTLGVDPNAPVATQRARLSEATAEIDRKIAAIKGDSLASEEQRLALTKRRGQIEVAANAMAEKERDALAKAAQERQDRRDASNDPRLGRLLLSPEGYAQDRNIDTGQPLTRQRLELGLAENERKREAIKEEAERIRLQREDKANVERVTKLDAEMATLVQQRNSLLQQMNALESKERKGAKGATGFLGGLFGKNEDDEGFGQGLAYSAGMTLRYYAMYAAFAALQQALGDVFTMTEQYTLAVTDLSIALGSSYEEAAKAGDEYTRIGRQYGTGPIESIEGATKGLRTFRTESGGVDEASGREYTKLVGLINTIEPEDRRQGSQQDVIAIAKAYQVGSAGLENLYDKLLTVGHEYGFATPGEILGGTAAVADIGRESGYSPEALAAAIASIMQGTGTTSDAAAGDLKRFLGAQNDPKLTQVFQRYGVDQDGTLKQKMDQLASKLSDVDPEERTRVLTGLGGPRIASSITALIAGQDEANRATGKAGDSSGAASKQAEEMLSSLSGLMTKLGVEFKGLFAALANSGLGVVFGTIITLFTQVVTAARQMVEAWNQFPDVMKDAAAALLFFFTVARAQMILSGAASAVKQGAQSLGLVAAQNGAAGAAGGLISKLGFLSGAMVAVGAVAAVGGALLYSASKSQAEKQEVAANGSLDANSALDTALNHNDPVAARAALEALKSSNEENKQGDDGFVNGFINWASELGGTDLKGARARMVAAIDAKIAAAEEKLKGVQAEADAADAQLPRSDWFGKNYNNITSGVDLIKAKGVSANGTSDIIADFFKNAPGNQVANFLQPVDGKGLEATVQYAMGRIEQSNNPLTQSSEYGKLHDALMGAKSRVDQSGDETQIEALRVLTQQLDRAWAASVVANTQAKIDILKSNFTGQGSADKIRATLTEGLNKAVASGSVDAIVTLLNLGDKTFIENYVAAKKAQNAALSSAVEAINTVLTATNEAQQKVFEPRTGNTDFVGPVTKRESTRPSDEVRAEQLTRQHRTKPPVLLPNPAAAQNKALDDALKLANPTGSATQKPTDDLAIAKASEAAQAGNGEEQASAAVKVAQIKVDTLVSQGKKFTAEYYDALKGLNDAKYSYAQYENNLAVAQAAALVPAGDPMAAARAAIEGTRTKLKAAVDPIEIANLTRQLADQQRSYAESQLSLAESEANANVRPNDPLAGAVAAMSQARGRMAFYKGRDSAKYFEALKSLRQSQYDAARIELEMANNTALLHIDITDPVAMAKQRVKQASDQLAFDRRRGAGKDVIVGDEAALRQTRSDAASTQWNQTFSDMRTNYDLNRIGLSAYMKYLQSQHDYLSAVKVKTRIQTEELNQVDAALKGLADSLDGQWNLGDIKVPTAYEMRRSLAGGNGPSSVSYVTITMTGSSTAEMKAALQGAIGQPILQTVGTTPPKV